MKRATFTVLFYLKGTKNMKDGPIPIYARITVNGQRAEFSLHKSIEKEEWNQQKGCILGYTKPAKQMNSFLELVRHKLYGYKMELEEEGKEVTASALRNAYLGIEENPRTILEVFREHNDWCKSLINIDFAKGTWERYEACYRVG